jgi:hypothetical protein
MESNIMTIYDISNYRLFKRYFEISLIKTIFEV